MRRLLLVTGLAAAAMGLLATGTAAGASSVPTGAIGSYHPCRAGVGGCGDRCVTAKHGDSLWRIARQSLLCANGRDSRPPRNAAVARQTRTLYRLNRRRVGRHPNRLRVGTE